jgi:hypothetical protein
MIGVVLAVLTALGGFFWNAWTARNQGVVMQSISDMLQRDLNRDGVPDVLQAIPPPAPKDADP